MATKSVEKPNKKPVKSKPAAAARGRTQAGASKKGSPAKGAVKAPARKAASAKTPPAKTSAKAAAKPAPKPPAKEPAKGPANKPAAPLGKPAPAKPSKAAPAKPDLKKAPAAAPQKGKGAPPEKAPVKKGVSEKDKKTAAPAKPGKAPAKKKLFVGQKPRSPKPSDQIVPSTIIAQQKAAPSVNSASVKASPAAVEAKQTFKVNDHIVYPAHGVGRIVAIEKQVIAGITNELFLIEFEQEKMKLRVPTAKAKAVGMRGLTEPAQVKKAIDLLKGRARIKRTMWSRRAQEYEAKINSGDIMQVAEVVRDLFRATDQPEQSYSERQLFEAALDRLAREVAAVHKTDLAKAVADLEAALAAKKTAN